MKYGAKTWIGIGVTIILLVAVGVIVFFASRYYNTERQRSAAALEVAKLDQQRLSRLAPTISTDFFNCSLPNDMHTAVRKDVYINVLATDVAAAEKRIRDVLKKYPETSEGVSTRNYSHSSSLNNQNRSTVNINGKVAATSIDAIVSDIQKLAKSDFVISSQTINTISANEVESSCNTNLVYAQGLVIKEIAYLNQLDKGNLDSNNLNQITEELSNVRFQFVSNKANNYYNTQKTLEEAGFSLSIDILNG